jgi:hypothetical protein
MSNTLTRHFYYWWNAIIAPVAGLFTKALDIVDDFVPDKDLANKLKAALKQQIMSIAHGEFLQLLKSQTAIILAEAKGGWLQRNWRPMLMMTFMIIIANNYIIHPYLALFAPGKSLQLTLPPEMWSLLKIGVGGYVVGRSVEKVTAGGITKLVEKVSDTFKG